MRPLHRSLTFWSGILVMAFLCWAWRDSFHRSAMAKWDYISSMNHDGGVSLGYYSMDPPGYLFEYEKRGHSREDWSPFQSLFFQRGYPHAELWVRENLKSAPNARRYFRLVMSHPFQKDSWMLFIPHWLILLAAIFAWFVLLVWRARRGKSPTVAEATP